VDTWPVNWISPKIGGTLALFYIHQVNWAKSHNGWWVCGYEVSHAESEAS